MRNKLVSLSILMLFIACCQAEKILVLTDIHFNPYSKCVPESRAGTCRSLDNLIDKPIGYWPAIFYKESVNGFKQETDNAFLTQGLDNLSEITKKDKIKAILIT